MLVDVRCNEHQRACSICSSFPPFRGRRTTNITTPIRYQRENCNEQRTTPNPFLDLKDTMNALQVDFSNPTNATFVGSAATITPINDRIAIYKDGRRQPIDFIGIRTDGAPQFLVAHNNGSIHEMDTRGLVRIERCPVSAWLEAGQPIEAQGN